MQCVLVFVLGECLGDISTATVIMLDFIHFYPIFSSRSCQGPTNGIYFFTYQLISGKVATKGNWSVAAYVVGLVWRGLVRGKVASVVNSI